MLIFGWGKTTKKDFGDTLPTTCPVCKEKTFLSYLRVKTWFTLFFIPVIPYSSKHYLLCGRCGNGKEIEYDNVDEILSINRLTQSYLSKEISKDRYQKKLAALNG
ncbi:zinc ribbon domain-containing protein [Thermoproteota archaeon]